MKVRLAKMLFIIMGESYMSHVIMRSCQVAHGLVMLFVYKKARELEVM